MNHARIATEALRFRLGTFSARVDSPPGLNADEAIRLMKRQRPGFKPNPGQIQQLRQFAEKWIAENP